MKKMKYLSVFLTALIVNGVAFSTASAGGNGPSAPSCIFHFDKVVFVLTSSPGILPADINGATQDIIIQNGLNTATNITQKIKDHIATLNIPSNFIPLVNINIIDILYQAEEACDVPIPCENCNG